MTNSEKPRVRRSPAAPKIEAKPPVHEEEKAVVAEAPEATEATEAPKESAVPQLSPKATVEEKMKEIEAKGHADLSTGQRFGAKLIAMAELRNKQ